MRLTIIGIAITFLVGEHQCGLSIIERPDRREDQRDGHAEKDYAHHVSCGRRFRACQMVGRVLPHLIASPLHYSVHLCM
jgi:hypothetical protein